MPTIVARKTQDGPRFVAIVRIIGHPIRKKTFTRKTDASRWATRVETEIRDGVHIAESREQKRTVADLIDRYEGEILPRYTPYARKRRTVQLAWWRHQMGRILLSEIRRPSVFEALGRLERGEGPTGQPCSTATLNRYLAVLRHAFNVAVRDWEWLQRNPLSGMGRREPRGRVRCLTLGERQRLLAACRASQDQRLFPLVLLALASGARQGELLDLRWADVDLERGIAIAQETKNGERRAIPVQGPALEVLRELALVRQHKDSVAIFGGGRGRASFPRHAWVEAVQAAGLEDFRFHDLRHTAASYLAMSGATVPELAEILGHKTLAMVKRYAHLTTSHSVQVAARMAEGLREAAKGDDFAESAGSP